MSSTNPTGKPRSYRAGLAQGLQTGGFVVILLAAAKLISNFVGLIAPGSQVAWSRFASDAGASLIEISLAGIMIAISPTIAHVGSNDTFMRQLIGYGGAALLITAIGIIWMAQKA